MGSSIDVQPILVHEQFVHQDEPRCEVGLQFAGMEPHVVGVVVRNPFPSCSNDLLMSIGGVGRGRSGLTRVEMRLIMRIRVYVQGSVIGK